jgi:hypothetical protein
MATTLEALEQRLATLEREVAELKAAAARPFPGESRGARLIRNADESHAAVVASWERFLKDLGIQGQPIGAKQLRERMLAQGTKPEDNAFSRELIAMREE